MIINVFRVLGDLTHALSKVVLIWAIYSNRSAEGVSLITQVLYAVVFCTRYLDLFWSSWFASGLRVWNTLFKIFYISSSLFIVFIMLRVFARSRERERAWRFGIGCFGGSLLLAPFAMMLLTHSWGFGIFLWVFSEILESVCVLPQLMLLRQTTVPTVIDSFYLVLLGSYRVFYILNWIVRETQESHYDDKVSWIFGTVQVLFYIDFAWVYWTRQRVKLRNGTVVDGDDIARGYLVGKVLGRGSTSVDVEGGEDDGRDEREGGWGARGISVSADDGIAASQGHSEGQGSGPSRYSDGSGTAAERTSIMQGDQEELDFDDNDGEEDGSPAHKDNPVVHSGVTGGEEWRSGKGQE